MEKYYVVKILNYINQMNNLDEVPKLPGIYELNGKINYCMNLQKKVKRCKGDFKVIKIMPNATEQELQNEIYDKVKEDGDDDRVVLHHYVNPTTGWSITSIFNKHHYDGFIQID